MRYIFIVMLFVFMGCGAEPTDVLEPEPSFVANQPLSIPEVPTPQVVEFTEFRAGNNTKSYDGKTVQFNAYVIFKSKEVPECLHVASTTNIFDSDAFLICEEDTHFLKFMGFETLYQFKVKVAFDAKSRLWYGVLISQPKIV